MRVVLALLLLLLPALTVLPLTANCVRYTNNTFLPKGQQATIPNKSPLRTYMDGAQPCQCFPRVRTSMPLRT